MHPVVPVRFVRACKKGHVGDIDWIAFVHGTERGCIRDLWMEERGTSGDLDEIWIVCECGAERAMSQAARMDLRALGYVMGRDHGLALGRESPVSGKSLVDSKRQQCVFPAANVCHLHP